MDIPEGTIARYYFYEAADNNIGPTGCKYIVQASMDSLFCLYHIDLGAFIEN